MMKVRQKSSWDEAEIADYLKKTVIPMRIAITDGDFPTICSLWFDYDPVQGVLICATHARSQIARLIAKNPRCAFEIASNTPPYCGVRGKAMIEVDAAAAAQSLPRLITRYMGDTNAGLGKWLMSRVDEELELQLKPVWISAWDYGQRMEPVKPA